MDRHLILGLSFLSRLVLLVVFVCHPGFGKAVSFAGNGSLKMLYDNRMFPQAVMQGGYAYIVWRGEKGFPYIIAYDLNTRSFSDSFMLLTGMENKVDAEKYTRDHHYAPIVWADGLGHLHVLFGCHGISGGVHLVSREPGDITQWTEGAVVSESVSYPMAHQIHGNGTLIYFRERGHLGSWTYSSSFDNGRTWTGPSSSVVDLDREPRDGYLAEYAGSYHTTQVSRDGRRLHVAFIWKVEEPVLNRRYGAILSDHDQRYNLYYLSVDLQSGQVFDPNGRSLTSPVNKSAADRYCLIWDTQERVAAVGPSIFVDEDDQPCFLLPVSEETPHRCRFYFVRQQSNRWVKTAITQTPHPFNASHLDRDAKGIFKAYLIAGDSEWQPQDEMDSYGWGDRVELWVSDRKGENWRLFEDLTPAGSYRYQNTKFVSLGDKGIAQDLILFYGWNDTGGPGTAFLWDNRK